MVSLLVLSEVDRLFKPGRVKPKTIKLVFVAPQSTQHLGERAKTSWLGIRIMCPEWGNMSICELAL